MSYFQNFRATKSKQRAENEKTPRVHNTKLIFGNRGQQLSGIPVLLPRSCVSRGMTFRKGGKLFHQSAISGVFAGPQYPYRPSNQEKRKHG